MLGKRSLCGKQFWRCAAHDSSTNDRARHQSAGFHHLHLLGLTKIKIFLFSLQIQHLTTRHALHACGFSKCGNKLDADCRVTMCPRIRQNFKCHRLQGVTCQDRRCLVKFYMTAWLSASGGGIIHRWQIIMHQRIGVQTFDCGGGAQHRL